MNEKQLLKTAKQDLKGFAERIVDDLSELADIYDYEFAWCVDEFRRAFSTAIKERKKNETN